MSPEDPDLILTPDEARTIADAYFDGDPILLDEAGPIIKRIADAADRALSASGFVPEETGR